MSSNHFRSKSKSLYAFDQLPDFLRNNTYVHGGYRVHLSKAECIRSIFTWSNETINIWSHLLGFILFTGFLIYDTVVMAPALELTPGEILSNVYFVLCIMYGLGASTLYHTLCCHSEKTYRRFLKLDIDGIAFTVSGVYVFGVHSAFGCFETWHVFYQIITGVLSVIVLTLHLKLKQKTSRDHVIMMVILTTWIAIGILIPAHLFYLLGGVQHPFGQSFLLQVVVYYLCMGGGFFFYLTRYPEKCCPGKVDYIGASHQLWHILTLCGFTWWHQRSVMNLQNKYEHGCPAPLLGSTHELPF